MDDAIKHTCTWPLARHNKYKSYNSLIPLNQLLTFSFNSQREREAMKDKKTHQGAKVHLNQNNISALPR